MKPFPFRHLIAPLSVVVALTLGSCASTQKTDEEQVSGETSAAQSTAPEEQKESKKEEEKKPTEEKPADKPEEPKEQAAVDPLKADEFKGVPKDVASFVLANRTLGATETRRETVTGRDGIVFSSRELRAIGANPQRIEARHQEIIAGISQYAAQLKARGIEFVITPVPPKSVIYPDHLGGDIKVKDKRLDTYLQSLYTDLKKAGVQVVDITKPLRTQRFAGATASFSRGGLVWSPAAVAVAADSTAKKIKRSAAVKTITPDATISSQPIGIAQNGETFRATSVGRLDNGKWVAAPVPKEGAAVLVIGDDNASSFRSQGQNAGLGDQLSLVLHTPVETRATTSTGWKEALKHIPAEGSPTKLVVWNFSAAAFLDLPALETPKPAPRRPRPTATPSYHPQITLPSGTGLRLRDDPGLEIRSE